MVAASDTLEGSVTLGYDSNPYKLSLPDTTQGASQYSAISFKYQGDNHREDSAKKANLKYRLALDKRIYKHSSAADSLRFDGHLRWIERFKLARKKASLLFSADIRSERNTYYSQTQRQVAETSEGDLIGDRFNFDTAGITGELIYYANQKQSWSLLTGLGRRSYTDDYSDVGLENLDFNEFRLQPGFRYKAESGANYRLFIYHKSRRYQDLHNNPVDKLSLLEYSLNGYGAVLRRPLTEKLDTSVYLSGYFARDNGSGTRNLDYHSLSVSLTYQFDSDAELQVNSQAYRREYLDQGIAPIESEIRLSGKQRTGVIAEVVYSKPLERDSFKGLIRLRNEHERNADDDLSYRRYAIEVGVEISL